jgi:ankyrin repeat protein
MYRTLFSLWTTFVLCSAHPGIEIVNDELLPAETTGNSKNLVRAVSQIMMNDSKTLKDQLLEASDSGNLSSVVLALEHGADIESFSDNYQHENALQVAAVNGHLDVVKYLVERGANLEAVHEDGEMITALHFAAMSGELEVLEYLIGKKANIETKDARGLTPLKNAALRDLFDVVKILADHGADINTNCKEFGMNAIHFTISSRGGKQIH